MNIGSRGHRQAWWRKSPVQPNSFVVRHDPSIPFTPSIPPSFCSLHYWWAVVLMRCGAEGNLLISDKGYTTQRKFVWSKERLHSSKCYCSVWMQRWTFLLCGSLVFELRSRLQIWTMSINNWHRGTELCQMGWSVTYNVDMQILSQHSIDDKIVIILVYCTFSSICCPALRHSSAHSSEQLRSAANQIASWAGHWVRL